MRIINCFMQNLHKRKNIKQGVDGEGIYSFLSPSVISGQIMNAVNKEFGLCTDAKGIVCAVPVEKALKI